MRSATFGGGRIERRDMVGEEESYGGGKKKKSERRELWWLGGVRRGERYGLGSWGRRDSTERERDNNKKIFDICFMRCQI